VIWNPGKCELKILCSSARGNPLFAFRRRSQNIFCSGLCCSFGYESVTINDIDGTTVWDHQSGGDSAFHSVIIHVAPDGSITTSDDQDTYITPGAMVTQGNMRQYTRDPETFDSLWPGIHPDRLDQMAVNVKLDMFPEVGSKSLEFILLSWHLTTTRHLVWHHT
jgi:hypothetical protein